MATNSSDADPCLTPLLANPSGGPPNFTHHTSSQPITIGVGITLLILAYLSLALRVTGTLSKERRLFLDDYFCVAGLALGTCLMVLDMINGKGYGHAWDISFCFINNESLVLRTRIESQFYLPALLFAKLAVGILYLRLFESIRWIRITVWACMTPFTLIFLIGFFLSLAQSVLNHWTWNPVNGLDLHAYQVVQGVATILLDLVLLTIPIQPIMSLPLSIRKKVGLLAVFLVGFIATACSISLLYWVVEFYYFSSHLDYHYLQDSTWVVSIGNLSSCMEQLVTIILSYVPGIVAAWRNVLRDTVLASKIRSLVGVSKTQSSQEDLNPKNSAEKFKVVINNKTVELNEV